MNRLTPFDKYHFYKTAVQSPVDDITFFKKTFKSFFKKEPRVFREDFCGTFYLAYHWVKNHSKNKAVAIDIDSKPLEYGKKNHLPKLNVLQKKQLKVLNKNVLSPKLPKAEIISINNFSCFALKDRKSLLKYFQNVRKSLFKKGLFIFDVVGGPDCESLAEEEVDHRNFTYYWEQKSFDPITRTGIFYIHFKRKGEKKKRLRQFVYDWRLWTLPELKDVLKEAGFSQIHVYWEGSDKKGEGTGLFKKAKSGEACDTWIAYLVCLP